MKLMRYEKVGAVPVDVDDANGCRIRCLIGQDDGAPSFTMRQFEIAAGGNTPKHSHAHEHEIFVLGGEGIVMDGNVERPIKTDYFVYVAPNEVHQFINNGSSPLKFLCLIPHQLREMRGTCVAACGCDG